MVIISSAPFFLHADITAPAQVRYAWADNPDTLLYNEAGLPASPFVYQPK